MHVHCSHKSKRAGTHASQPIILLDNHQLFVFVLHIQPGGDAVPGVQEGSALALLGEVVNEEADEVDGEEDEDVGGELLPAVQERGGRVHGRQAHEGVQQRQHQGVAPCNPAPNNYYYSTKKIQTIVLISGNNNNLIVPSNPAQI